MERLPIDAVLPELVEALRTRGNAVLEAPPGAGKTTRVPPALLAAGLAGTGSVLILEPRRVAARAAARRIAAEQGFTTGREVGWQIRFERQATRATRLLFLTEGVLVQRLQSDPFLEGVGAIVFDEFHERSLFADLSLALARRVQRDARPDLSIVAMSATLDGAPLAAFLDAPVVRSEGRTHPVELEYLDAPAGDTSLPTLVARGVRRGLTATGGDLLVFLPGVGEIRRCEEALAALARENRLAVVPLFGDLPLEEQDRALGRSDRRKVVLATNVAETSVTIDGVTGVIDSGLARQLEADPANGLERLVTSRISRASATQRTGRAGRQSPGWCLRLWTQVEQRGLAERTAPEISRADLAWAALQLHAWGESDLASFPWFESPEHAALERAERTLAALGGLDALAHGSQPASPKITALGRRMAELPLHPRLARMALEGAATGIPEEAALVAALLSDREANRDARRNRRAGSSESDLLDALDGAQRSRTGSTLLRSRDQIVRLVRGGVAATPTRGRFPEEVDDALRRVIASAFLDRLCRRREPGSDRAVMNGGRGVRLARESAVKQAELFVAVELDDRAGVRSETLVHRASAVDADWLPTERTRRLVDLEFDETKERVVALRRTWFDELVLEEKEIPVPDLAAAERTLVDAASSRIERVVPAAADDPEWRGLLERIRCLRRHVPELELPEPDTEWLSGCLPFLAAGARSFAELRRAPWRATLLGRLTHAQRTALDREAPERLSVPSGSRIALDYSDPDRPVLAARIQELFGLSESPRVARGRVAVLMHLLAPNGRPQQVTDDLASFWNRTYIEVRKELAARYPRHAWPLDPWNAPPEKRPQRRS